MYTLSALISKAIYSTKYNMLKQTEVCLGDREMTEFDNWNSEQKRMVPSNTGRFHTLVDSERKRAWKAALEWALKNLEESYKKLASGDMGWEGGFIEDELNAKT